MPYNPDFNGPRQEGTGIYQTTIRNNRRCSAAVGYLRPALQRRNLTVVTGALVRRVVFDGTRAIGVDNVTGDMPMIARAASEVIVTAGAIGSPKLMMLSGVGPAAHLSGLGITVIQDLPGVGQNLTDHYCIDIVAQLKGHESLDKYKRPHWAAIAGVQYFLFNSGPITSNVVEGGAFWYSGGPGSAPRPDLQFHFLCGAGAEAGVPSVPNGASGITLNSYNLRPKSRGSVALRSADPQAAPIVDPNFLADPDDLRLCHSINAPNVGIAVDVYHVWWDTTLADSLAAAHGHVLGYHLCDWHETTTDLLHDRGMMGDGVADLPAIRRAVEENAGYAGPCEVEIFSAGIWWKRDPAQVLDVILDRFRHCC